jgi:hypothetical protein
LEEAFRDLPDCGRLINIYTENAIEVEVVRYVLRNNMFVERWPL